MIKAMDLTRIHILANTSSPMKLIMAQAMTKAILPLNTLLML